MDPTMLMARRAGRPEPEAEPVLVELRGADVVLTLDDGEEITLDRRELLAAMDDAPTLEAAA